ncbi:MAG: hypothetical protein GX594_13890 [Pirellulaceae bacterium]|nr:hypothetical protein [Pirellulaceae bacterium]
MIEADAGGGNGYRQHWWKHALQRWAGEDGLTITVDHYPTGASKWSSVEHRLYGPISLNWAGKPLDSLEKNTRADSWHAHRHRLESRRLPLIPARYSHPPPVCRGRRGMPAAAFADRTIAASASSS